MNNYAIAVHGGVGSMSRIKADPSLEDDYKKAIRESLEAGEGILKKGGSALDAVEIAIIKLEDNPLFNAARGSVFTHEGKIELDASIMDGKTLLAGAVASVHNVKNPVSLARTVMEKSEHVMLCGAGAENFARKMNLEFQPDEYFFTQHRYEQLRAMLEANETMLDIVKGDEEKKHGTVGAVALDINKNIAAATSTGGMTNKMYGRIGDSPIIGAGVYANNKTCAVSCTGHGEYFIRSVVAYDISCLMEYKGLTLKEACNFVIKDKLIGLSAEGGLIAVDNKGNIELTYNTKAMYRGMKKSDTSYFIAIF